MNRPRPAAGPPATAATGSLPRALGAVGLLVLLLIAVPAALVALGGALAVDIGALAPGALLRPDDGALLLVLLLAVAWAAWAVMAVSVGLEVSSAVRRVPTPRLRGLAAPQRLASALVASIMVVIASGAATAGPASASHVASGPPSLSLAVASVASHATDATAPDGQPAGRAEADAAAAPVIAQPAKDAPSVVVARHDTLWRLAERHLGAGERYAEIVALNMGVAQPDGRALGPDGRIYPGWTLVLPADAQHGDTVIDLRSGDAHVAPSSEAEHVVEQGESLWSIADEELGDPLRFPELYEENRGDLQPDGRRLVDPDLILSGWVLELPSDAETADPGVDEVAPGTDEEAAETPVVDGPEPPVRAPHPGLPVPGADAAPESLPDLDRGLPSATAPAPKAGRPAELPVPTPTAPTSAAAPAPSTTSAPALSAPATIERADTIDRAASLDPTAVVAFADGLDEASALPEGGALGALLLVGIAGELARRRRQFQRHRRPGERMPRLSARAAAFEATLREHGGQADPAVLERALTQLSRSAREAGVSVPAVQVVRASRSGVELTLAQEWSAAQPLAPFAAVDSRCWRLDPSLLDAAEEPAERGVSTAGAAASPAAEQADLAPDRALAGLVALGTDEQETVLIDLAERGTLRLAGDPDLVADVLRGLTVEASFGPLRSTAARTVCLADSDVVEGAEAGELTLASPGQAAALLAEGLKDRGEGDPLEVVLTDQPLGRDGQDLVAAPRSGAALVTTAAPGRGREPVPDDGAPGDSTLRIESDGAATLLPDGIRLVPQALDAGGAAALVELLAAADVPVDPEPPGDEEARAEQARDAAIDAGPSAQTGATRAPHLLLLGEVRVEGATGKVESTRIGRLAETVAFVHLNPESRPSALQSALWPGRRSSSQTCRQMLTRARTWLGRGEDGEPYLLQLSQAEGRLRLRPEVTSDWTEFQRLASAGLADPQDLEHLAAALRLVRGRPFGSVAARELPWADLHVNEMIALIVDVAHELAVRQERAGNWSAARDAALRGLRTECESEVLEGIVVRLGRQM